MDYVSEYRRLEACLKVAYEDFRVLHHNVIGSPFLHEMLGDLYELVGERTDEIVEIGIAIGVPEVNILESCEQFEPLKATFRNDLETVNATVVVLERLQEVIGAVRSVVETIDDLDDVLSLFDDVKVKLRRENYKFRMVLEGLPMAMTAVGN